MMICCNLRLINGISFEELIVGVEHAISHSFLGSSWRHWRIKFIGFDNTPNHSKRLYDILTLLVATKTMGFLLTWAFCLAGLLLSIYNDVCLYTSYHSWTPSTNSERERERCKMEAKAHNSRVRNVVSGPFGVSSPLLVHDKKWGHSPPKKKKLMGVPLVWGWKATSTFVNFAKSRNVIWEHASVEAPHCGVSLSHALNILCGLPFSSKRQKPKERKKKIWKERKKKKKRKREFKHRDRFTTIIIISQPGRQADTKWVCVAIDSSLPPPPS